ncbi:hypothetical protein [Vreelandella subglaciescola]|jgi:hypothetical protein|uniref:Uncharacterized protein n=1 Tax=Vreelandella subglaciescola TaxID=29571 RepID=A0A1M7IEF8_9GAMM|nr:hypothetical protein [Halomonas subglaciescola]SHM38983.1 hypothetical protein SAMN05878437_2707 [Halomonas subglaciescola]
MTIFVIWVIAFAVIFYLANKRWNDGVSQGVDKMLTAMLKSHGKNRYIWVAAIAVLGATALVRPVDVLLVVILLAIIALVVAKVASVVTNKVS